MSSTAFSALHLTPREERIILTIYLYDGLFTEQIRRRFWPDSKALSWFYERVSRLVKHDFLREQQMPSWTGRGSGTRLFTIGASSHPLLKDWLALGSSEIRRLRHSLPLSKWKHEHQCRDIRLSVELAVGASAAVDSYDWTNESELASSPIRVKISDPLKEGRLTLVELVPDGKFTLTLATGKQKQYLLELDRDDDPTSRQLRWRKRIRAYFNHIGDQRIPVLTAVKTKRRVQVLQKLVAQEAAALEANPSVFAFCDFHQVSETTILHQPIWQVVGLDQVQPLVPQLHQEEKAPQEPRSWAELTLGAEFLLRKEIASA